MTRNPRTPRSSDTAPKIDRRHRLDAGGWIESGRWANVSSSNVAAIMFDQLRQRLYVQFLPSTKFPSGSVYYYLDVPDDIAVEIFNAGSIGVYLNRVIKPRFTAAGPFASREVAP